MWDFVSLFLVWEWVAFRWSATKTWIMWRRRFVILHVWRHFLGFGTFADPFSDLIPSCLSLMPSSSSYRLHTAQYFACYRRSDGKLCILRQWWASDPHVVTLSGAFIVGTADGVTFSGSFQSRAVSNSATMLLYVRQYQRLGTISNHTLLLHVLCTAMYFAQKPTTPLSTRQGILECQGKVPFQVPESAEHVGSSEWLPL